MDVKKWLTSTTVWSGSAGDKGSPCAHNPGATIPGVFDFEISSVIYLSMVILPIMIQKKRKQLKNQ